MRAGTKWAALAGCVLAAGGLFLAAAGRLLRPFSPPPEADKIRVLPKLLDENPRSIFLYDPVLSYRLKPLFRGTRHDDPESEHVTNSLGLLGEKEPDPRRRPWLFLGDSVLYGSHVPFPGTFSALLAARGAGGIQVLNAGCPGWSTRQELLFWKEHLGGLEPEKTFVVFCLNDLLRFEWVWRDSESFRVSEEVAGLGGLLEAQGRSLALRNLARDFRKNPGLAPLADLNNSSLAAWRRESWEDFSGEIGEMLPRLRERAEIVFLPVPARAQLEALNAGGDPRVVLYPQKVLESLAAAWGCGFLDPLEAFRRPGETGYDTGFFLPGERGELHLSPAGHRALADFLSARLFSR